MRTASTSTGLNKSWALRFNRSLSTLTNAYMSRRALSMNLLQVKRPLHNRNSQSLSSSNSNNSNSNSQFLHRATLSPLLHVSPLPNSPSIRLMDNLLQDKMEARLAQLRRHDNTLALHQQRPSGGRFLSPNDELNSVG